MVKKDMLNKRLAKEQERMNKFLEGAQKCKERMRKIRFEKYEPIITFLEKHNVEDLKEVKSMYDITCYLKGKGVRSLSDLEQRLASSTGNSQAPSASPEMTRYAQNNNAQELQ